MFGLRQWIVGLLAALFANAVVLALATYSKTELTKIERAAGPSLSVMGSESLFADIEGDNEDAKEVKSKEIKTAAIDETPIKKVLETSPDKTVQDVAPQVTPEEVKELPDNEILAVLPAEPKPRAEKKPVEKPKPKKNSKQKKKKKKKAKQKGGKGTAAARQGGGNKGKQSNVSGRASASNYRGKVRSHLARRKQRAGSNRGTAVVSFTVTGSGGVAGVRLARRSGNAAIDRAALSMVRRASPFPRIPAGLPRRMRFTVPVHFR